MESVRQIGKNCRGLGFTKTKSGNGDERFTAIRASLYGRILGLGETNKNSIKQESIVT